VHDAIEVKDDVVTSHTASLARVLIAGIGNIFFGDDAFGSHVARRLAFRQLPDGVRVGDFGIRGLDLAYALTDGYDLAILIDVTPQGGPAGTLYIIEPDLTGTDDADKPGPSLADGHTLEPRSVLRLARQIGGCCPRIRLVGCEPAELGCEGGSMELSTPVQSAVDEACALVQSLVADFLREKQSISPVGRPVSAK
jgi:hydrogenase maturation protease